MSAKFSAILFLIVLSLAVALIGSCGQPPPTPHGPILLHLAGSTSMQPLLHDLAAAYSERYEYVGFDFSAVGSAAGIELLQRGNADLALVSRRLRPEEEYDSQTGKRLLAYTVIAQDGIAIVVNEKNPLRSLTMYQVRKIFEGQILSWAELDSPAGDIQVISREDGSATRDVFEDLVMRGRRVTTTALIMPSSEAVRDYIAAHEGAIGYLSLGYLGPGIAALAIDNVLPSRETVENGSYPLTRPFLLVSLPDPEAQIVAFMQFARSPAGQAIVRRNYGGVRAGGAR
ncbi:MAG: phosphate ABC transporter substrate-binding protein [Chloroflexi bacterium]|nr:phosphate ABC transporter substrate-binding protein [Chloroflexota bacterium]